MLELNDQNGASKHTHEFIEKCLTEFEGELFGVEMGCPYGGALARMAQKWGNRTGGIWGFDTFEGHPKEIADVCEATKSVGGRDSHAALCMDPQYDMNGTEGIKYESIRNGLDALGLEKVSLVKGLFTSETNIDFIKKLHYCMVDFDFPLSQWDGYNAVKEKIVKGGYLCLHDMIPHGHIHGNYEIYQKILAENLFDAVREVPSAYLVVLKKK